MKSWVLLIILMTAFKAHGSFDRQYEYRSFSINERKLYDYYNKIDSEYSSDILVYSFSPEEEVHFQNTDKKLLISLGSLSRIEFMKDMRLKIKQNLSSQIDFRYNYIEQKDYENSQTHSIFEFGIHFSEKFRVAAFADLDFAKVNDNLGFSASYLPKSNHEIKFFYNKVQFDRNKRNPNDDHYIKKPYALGFVGRYKKNKYNSIKYFEYGFLNETPTDWNFPSQDLNYTYHRWMGTLRYHTPISEMESLSIFYQVDHRSEKRAGYISPMSAVNSFDLKRNQLQVNYRNKDYDKFELESGSYLVNRDAEFIGARRRDFDILPYTTFHFNKDEGDVGFWSLGYDITIPNHSHLEHRANVYWTARFERNASLRLIGTLDVDDGTWEGGSGQFAMEF